MYTLEGVSSVANFITIYKESIKPRLPFPICIVFFVSKGNLLDFFLFAFQTICIKCQLLFSGKIRKLLFQNVIC